MYCRLFLFISFLACTPHQESQSQSQSQAPTSTSSTSRHKTSPFLRKLTSEQDSSPDLTSVKRSGNLPQMTRAMLKQAEEKKQQCIKNCRTRRQAEAIAAEMIDRQCRQGCEAEHFIGQVEVID